MATRPATELDEAAARRSAGRSTCIGTVYKGKHYRVGVALVNLAGLYAAAAQGLRPRAERLFRRGAATLYAEVLPADHQDTWASRGCEWGRALVEQKRYEDAERHLAEACRILLAQRQPPASLLETARQELAGVYDALQQPEKGAKIRREHSATTRRP